LISTHPGHSRLRRHNRLNHRISQPRRRLFGQNLIPAEFADFWCR
jgi:hypothetical protein